MSLGFAQTKDAVPEFFSYRVKIGDSRWNMAQDFGISLDSLWKLNPHLSEYSMELPVGIVITLPKKEINSSLSDLNEVESSASQPDKDQYLHKHCLEILLAQKDLFA